MGVKISELNSAEQVQNNDVLPIVQNDETKKVTKEILLQEVVASLSEKAEADNVYTKEESNTLLNGKVDKVAGKGLSTEDYTTEDKGQVATNKINIGTLQADSGATIELEMNTTNYVLTAKLKNKAGTVVSTTGVDLPIESAIVDGYYDNVNKKIVLVLQNGNTIDVPVGDLISGLQAEITEQNKLSSDLVDDTNKTNKFVTSQEKTNWNAKYDKPNSGIPKSDLSSEVQTSLGKADTALQEHQDISGKEDKSNKVTSLSSSSTDTQYPTAKAVYDSQVEQDNEISVLRNLAETELEDATATGTSITVNDSANAPAKLLPSGNTSQQQYEGYNLLNVADRIFNTTGSDQYLFQNFALDNTKSYKLKMDYEYINAEFSSSGGVIMAKKDSNYSSLKSSSADAKGSISSDITGTSQLSVYVTTRLSAGQVKISKIMLYEGTEEKPYEPYVGNQPSPSSSYPQTIHTVSGNNQIKIQNKNLLNLISSTIVANTNVDVDIIGSNSMDLTNETHGGYLSAKFKLDLNLEDFLGKKIYFSYSSTNEKSRVYLALLNEDYSTVSSMQLSPYIVPSDTTAKYLGLVIYSSYNSDSYNQTSHFTNMYVSTFDENYIAHQEQNLEFTLAEGQKMFEGDYLADDGIHHVMREITLNGTESWTNKNITDNYLLFSTNVIDSLFDINQNSKAKSNYFIRNGNLWSDDTTPAFNIYNQTRALRFRIAKEELSDISTENKAIESWKTWLSNHNTICQYQQLTETIEPYTETQQAQYNAMKEVMSYFEQTNVNTISAGDLEAILNLEHKKSNRLRIDALEQAIISLGGNV